MHRSNAQSSIRCPKCQNLLNAGAIICTCCGTQIRPLPSQTQNPLPASSSTKSQSQGQIILPGSNILGANLPAPSQLHPSFTPMRGVNSPGNPQLGPNDPTNQSGLAQQMPPIPGQYFVSPHFQPRLTKVPGRRGISSKLAYGLAIGLIFLRVIFYIVFDVMRHY